jgi:Flp pilus assembly pilin Flp
MKMVSRIWSWRPSNHRRERRLSPVKLREEFVNYFSGWLYHIKDENGQTVTEYALTIILIAIAVILALKGTGLRVNSLYCTINSSLP